uniref:Uncharacterized protein n=1 Tax=Nelumbo nucifera TaxID=4432 RepID=A0A822YYZ7_NELNU|nr:TPA_asm: hypothetical protein HUJ06_008104 [Nelumbo nucifera]
MVFLVINLWSCECHEDGKLDYDGILLLVLLFL